MNLTKKYTTMIKQEEITRSTEELKKFLYFEYDKITRNNETD